MMKMTVQCILCRGMILYKDGDITRFSAHLANEHGAFYDVEYLLASCFMDEGQKAAIANPIRVQQEHYQTQQEQSYQAQSYQPAAQTQDGDPLLTLTDQTPETDAETSRHACDKCGKSYTRREGLKKHILKAHSAAAVKDEATVEEMDESQTDVSFDSAADTLIDDINKELDSLDQDTDSSMDSSMDTSTEESTTGDRPYKCTKCTKSFPKNWVLKNHLKTHADKEAGVEYKCEECSHTCTTKMGIYSHRKNKHNFKPKQSSEEEEKLNETSESSSDKTSSKIAANNEALAEKLLKEGVDLQKSNYFKITKQVMFDGSQLAATFTEASPYLPEGWKMKTVETKDKTRVVVHKHYLSPAHALIKTTLGVVEYLRLEGKLSPEALLDTATALRVGPKKLKKLYSSDPSDNDETVAEA